MTKFNSYVRKVDELAKKSFEAYIEAKAGLDAAESAYRTFPQRQGGIENADALRAKANLLAAQERMRQVKRDMDAGNDAVSAVRRELSVALADAFAADPSQIDANTMTLLQSGILRGHEYRRLMDAAAKADNHTMQRIISRFAENAAVEAAERYGQGDAAAQELRVIAHQGSADPATSKLQEFDALADIFRRTMRNTAMIGSWSQLAGPIVEGF